jgi:hypothetical protein
MKMPELPPRAFQTTKGGEWIDAYTADELRAYGELVREECAKVCDQDVVHLSEKGENRAALAVGIVAAAIRSGA